MLVKYVCVGIADNTVKADSAPLLHGVKSRSIRTDLERGGLVRKQILRCFSHFFTVGFALLQFYQNK